MAKNKTAIIVTAIFVIALAVRISLFSGIISKNPGGFFQTDSYGYWQIADNIINHSSFSQSASPPFIPDHARTPVYPLFVVLLKTIGLGTASIIFIQILFSSATCLLVILLTYRLTGSWIPAYFAGAFLAIDVPSIIL